MAIHPFTQVDVFSPVAFGGNALAVVHDADDLTDGQMAAIARWTNLSETTFLTRPTTPEADYRVRIFTTGGELPFAGHPTLGSCRAWLDRGGVPHREGLAVQECGAGLIPVRVAGRPAFAAPDLIRSGPVDPEVAARVLAANGLSAEQVVGMSWIDNGPGWIGVELDSAATVLAIEPDTTAYLGLKVAVLGRHTRQDARTLGVDVEVRAFYADGRDFSEDPVTGSANAGLAQWLIGSDRLPAAYVAGQGRRLGRDGRVHVHTEDSRVWIGGDVGMLVRGEIRL